MEYDYYILKMERLVEPILIGPYSTEQEAEDIAEENREDPAFERDTFIVIEVSKGAEINV